MTSEMMTLKAESYIEISKQISELEKAKKRIGAELLQAMDESGIDNFHGLRIVERVTETIKKGSVPAAIWERFKTTSTSRFIKRA